MQPFIRVTEIWLPTDDRLALRFGGGLYGELDAFRDVSAATRFAFGEGLPGKAWAERQPIILKRLEGSYFRRAAAAKAAGLTCGVALPIFAGQFLLAVIVFFCGGEHAHVGAIETWANDPSVSSQIGLVDGYYGTAELFEGHSRMATYGRGHGLPGQAWAAGAPVFAAELFRSGRLLRREEGLKVGPNAGLAIPFSGDPARDWVMTFLSSSGTPIARRFETWRASPDGARLVREPADGEGAPVELGREDGAIGRILLTGLPQVSTDLARDAPATAEAASADGASALVALPVMTREGRLAAVASWYF